MIALLDVNVLLALSWTNHPHYNAAHDWFSREASAGWATCLLTQSGFLRLTMNPQIVGASIDFATAHTFLQTLIAHPDHRFIDVAPSLTEHEFADVAPRISGYRQMSDAVLVYLARIHGLKLVTFDKAVSSLCPWSENILVLSPALPSSS